MECNVCDTGYMMLIYLVALNDQPIGVFGRGCRLMSIRVVVIVTGDHQIGATARIMRCSPHTNHLQHYHWYACNASED